MNQENFSVFEDGGPGIHLRRLVTGLIAEQMVNFADRNIYSCGQRFRSNLPELPVSLSVIRIVGIGKTRLRDALDTHGKGKPRIVHSAALPVRDFAVQDTASIRMAVTASAIFSEMSYSRTVCVFIRMASPLHFFAGFSTTAATPRHLTL